MQTSIGSAVLDSKVLLLVLIFCTVFMPTSMRVGLWATILIVWLAGYLIRMRFRTRSDFF
ncbi:MAG: hypothetical protein ABIH41_05235 [Nanoarchaeota archaeon]